jgi:hypothetical protein
VEISFDIGDSSVRKLLKTRQNYFTLISNLHEHDSGLLDLNEGELQRTTPYRFIDLPKFEEFLVQSNPQI